MIDDSMTETFQLQLPADLLAAAKRQSPPQGRELHVEGWRTTWLSRMSELWVGKD